jgi:hypothetical protein
VGERFGDEERTSRDRKSRLKKEPKNVLFSMYSYYGLKAKSLSKKYVFILYLTIY